MFIDPKVAIENGWVTGITNHDTQIQPNAIDFTLDRLFSINDKNTFVIDEDSKKMRGGDEINSWPARVGGRPYWTMTNGIYDGLSNIFVDLPEGVVCLPVMGRSTFTRNGIFITSGLYDSGFKGHVGFVVHNRSGRAQVGVGTRIGQIAFVESAKAGLYAGGYNHTEGTEAPHQE
jgi:deoxycytidine triphosphate deaminase